MVMFNFSDAYRSQGFLSWLESRLGDSLQLCDFREVSGTSCYLDPSAREMLSVALPRPLPRVRWMDSGDYHYMSHLLALEETEPFHLVLLDNHPDNQKPVFPGVLSCGSWVRDLSRENPLLRSVLTIGPEGCAQHIPDGWIRERQGERVYVSLDKDILDRDFARTDWTQGCFTLTQVKDMLRELVQGMDVAAVDICGELQESKGATPEDQRINFETNIDLYTFITNQLK